MSKEEILSPFSLSVPEQIVLFIHSYSQAYSCSSPQGNQSCCPAHTRGLAQLCSQCCGFWVLQLFCKMPSIFIS